MYEQVARDNPATASLTLLAWLTLASSGIVGYFFGSSAVWQKYLRGQRAERTVEERGIEINRLSLGLYILFAFLYVTLAAQVISLVRINYINSADTHYHIVLRAAAPYLAPGEQTQVESDFTQIHSRADYVKLVSKLEAQCKANGRQIPKFEPW